MLLRMLMAGSKGTVSFNSATGPAYIASGMSINTPSTPAGIVSGDAVFAIVFGRSALTPPAGWTLVSSQANTGTVTQTLYIYRKDSVSPSDSSSAFTWSQSVSGRMGLGYLVARSTSGSVLVQDSKTKTTSYPTAQALPQSVLVEPHTSLHDGALFIVAASSAAATTAGSSNIWVASTSFTARSAASVADNRIFFQTRGVNSSGSNSSPIQFSPGPTAIANYYSTISLLVYAG